MKKILFCTLLTAMCFVSCKRAEVELTNTTGSLALNLTDLTDYITVKSDMSGVDFTDFSAYDVVVNGPTVIKEKFSSFSGRVVELGSGNYSITVTSPYTLPAAFEQPIYRAAENFEIRAGEVTALNLVCEPYNCKVTIELTENFKKELATYEVIVSNGLGELVWTKNEEKDDFAQNKAGYFLPRGLEVKVKGHRSIDDTEATAIYYVKNPMAADHHIIKLDAKVTGQVGGITIDVITEFNEINNDITVDGMDETYVDRPDFGDGTDEGEEEETVKNTITWAGNEMFLPVTIEPASQIKMVINMEAGIETFIVEVSDNFKSAVSAITDGGVTYMDLINDPKIHESFGGDKSALPTKDEIYHQTEVIFDLTTFVPILCGTASGMTVDFILKATDIHGNELKFMGDYPTVTMTIP